MKKFFVAALPMFIITSLFSTGLFNPKSVSALGYVNVDTNASIQLITDSNNIVLSASAEDEEGEIVLLTEEDTLVGLSIDNAIYQVVETAVETGYLDPGTLLETEAADIISVTAMLSTLTEVEENDFNEELIERLQERLTDNGIFGQIIPQELIEELQPEAESLGISASKLFLINKVIEAYPEYTLEEGILALRNELMELLKAVGTVETRVTSQATIIEETLTEILNTTTQINELNLSLIQANETLTLLNNVVIDTFEEAELASHNLEIELIETEILEIETNITNTQNTLTELETTLAEQENYLTILETHLAEVEERRTTCEENAMSCFRNWQENREMRANQLRERYRNESAFED